MISLSQSSGRGERCFSVLSPSPSPSLLFPSLYLEMIVCCRPTPHLLFPLNPKPCLSPAQTWLSGHTK